MLWLYKERDVDKEQNEIDIMIYQNMSVYHLKNHTKPRRGAIKSFSVLDKTPDIKRGPGGVICPYDRPRGLGEQDVAIPVE